MTGMSDERRQLGWQPPDDETHHDRNAGAGGGRRGGLIARSQQAANGSASVLHANGPLIARGYTDAPAGTVVIANDPNGGWVLKELRIREGQWVKRDEVIAVLANYPVYEVNVQIAENNLRKVEKVRDTVSRARASSTSSSRRMR